jgi:hypothetical protein
LGCCWRCWICPPSPHHNGTIIRLPIHHFVKCLFISLGCNLWWPSQ